MNNQTEDYAQPERGQLSDYERYLQGMDASMQQKVALTAAHLLGQGWLADMGMGSGTGTEALAALYPSIQVTGVDISEQMVAMAQQKYQRPNLDFRLGDIAQSCFEDESLDVIFDSSVLHHVTTFNDYDHSMAEVAIRNQVRQLKVGGNLIVRDFLRPEPGLIWLELPDQTADLFCRFAREFRFLKPEGKRGFPYQELANPQLGWKRFEVESVHAVEFVLRKDYLADWSTEVLEEYTYFTQSQFESVFRQQGLRLLASTPLRNPWIVTNRFEGQFRFLDTSGNPLEYPPTNYLVVGEKVSPHSGVAFQHDEEIAPMGFLEFAHYRHKTTGKTKDLVRRPNATIDVIPYFERGGEVYVLVRRSYARPLLALSNPRIDGGLSPSFVTEPIVITQSDKPMAQTVEEALEIKAGISASVVVDFDFGSVTYPSPGGIQEQVQAVFVNIQETLQSQGQERVCAISARQLMRSAQVGGLPDARLELHCYELLRLLNKPLDSWIGQSLELNAPPAQVPPQSPSNPLFVKPRRAFERAELGSQFLHLGCREFRELSNLGTTVTTSRLEYVRPQKLSLHTVSVALLWRVDQTLYLGLQDNDFAAAQCFCGHSNLWVTPAWRLNPDITTLTQMTDFLKNRVLLEHGVTSGGCFTLGGPYFPSAGVTPEVVYPWALEVTAQGTTLEPLTWVSLDDLTANFTSLRDGHLKTVVARLARAWCP